MPPATVRRAPYKDFLQPALHRRFSTTASILLAIAYLQAILFGLPGSAFWSWFPIGPAGIRTLFLSLCGLSVIVLRIAQYHVGARTSNSGFQSFAQNVFQIQTLEALFTYIFSGWLFSQIWLWSCGPDSGLGWITYFSGDRARLNEKPLFFTCYFVILGIVEAVLHLFYDNDRLSLGVVKPTNGQKQGGDTASQFKQFYAQIPRIFIGSIGRAVGTVFLSLVVYPIFFRGIVWRTSLFFLRPFYNLPKTNMLPTAWPFAFWVLGWCIVAGVLLSIVWTAGNAAFSIFLVREPLKHGKPLTTESKDPNGSLLNGLKSKKLAIKCFAMWELAFIARDYEARRKAIYEDIDRKEGPMWSQVYVLCLETIKSIEARIDNYGRAPAPVASAALTTVDEKKRTTQPPRQDEIMQTTPKKKQPFRQEVEKLVGQVATAPGQPSQLSPLAKKAMDTAKTKFLELQKEATGTDDTQSLFRDLALKVLDTPVGWPFRQEFNRCLTAVVLGTPYGEPSLYINAINALSLLAVHSLKEDKYGNVQRDVATILRTLTTVTSKLERFKSAFPLHWTDVEKDKSSAEVDAIIEALREGLKELVQAFGPYARDLRLSLTDMRLAKEAAGIERDEQVIRRDEEMREVR
ncbi:nucleoporin protein Ndc1-Nup [Coniochaeta sp. 2T2.1]|nr:nucleoporin protein Ndc1-Nup [Coniochaeta sp. 2T2.1]